MTGTCGTCKHWTTIAEMPNPGWGPRITAYGVEVTDEATAEINRNLGKCREIDMFCDRPNPVDIHTITDLPLAFTEDGSMYRADLWTRREFGCALHSPVEPAP